MSGLWVGGSVVSGSVVGGFNKIYYHYIKNLKKKSSVLARLTNFMSLI